MTQQQRPINAPNELLPRARRRENITARKWNRIVEGLNKLVQRPNKPREIIPTPRAVGGGVDILEVKIIKAIAGPQDIGDQREQDNFDEFGPHLKCIAVTPATAGGPPGPPRPPPPPVLPEPPPPGGAV